MTKRGVSDVERAAEEERVWSAGYTAAMRSVLRLAMRELPGGGRGKPGLLIERSDTVRVLREICGLHGDNDWPDDLYLADVIEKHLGRHLGM